MLDERQLRRWPSTTAVLIALALLGAVLSPVRAEAAPKPPNPSDGQIHKAQHAKDVAARSVGAVSARIATLESRLAKLRSDAQLAEQKLALARQKEHEAKVAAERAHGAVDQARGAVIAAQRNLAAYAQAAYMSGDIGGTTGALLVAQDPSALLQQSTMQEYVSSHKLDALGQLDQATVAKSNADAAARAAFTRRAVTTRAAKTAQANVLIALSNARTQRAGLGKQLASQKVALRRAQVAVTGLRNKRAAFLAWKQRQAEIAAREAERRRQQRIAQRIAARKAAERLRIDQGVSGSHSGGQGSRGASGADRPLPAGGGWTAARGRQAVQRVTGFLGMPYSWAAGNASGPTYGVREPGGGWNDCHIVGFDCSGLTIYAWAPYLSMDHYAATQYSQAGSFHPSINALMPGDLVFWSGNGTQAGIGHEAMYIGNGNVIQAPQSGDVIKITNVYAVESGYFGATRPLT